MASPVKKVDGNKIAFLILHSSAGFSSLGGGNKRANLFSL